MRRKLAEDRQFAMVLSGAAADMETDMEKAPR